jgi:F-type H+-transporting ATPase subunit epsilon
MEPKDLYLVIASPEKTLFEGKVESVTVPGSLSRFTVLPQHAPIISSLAKGMIECEVKGEKQTFEVAGGFIEVKKNEVSICVE